MAGRERGTGAWGRPDRVGEQVRREVSGILRFAFADPRIARATVTRVEMTRDLSVARVRVSVLGSPREREETLKALGRAEGRVRSMLGGRIRLRQTPEVRFLFDPSVEFSVRLEKILEEERSRRPARPEGDGGDHDDEAEAGSRKDD